MIKLHMPLWQPGGARSGVVPDSSVRDARPVIEAQAARRNESPLSAKSRKRHPHQLKYLLNSDVCLHRHPLSRREDQHGKR
jgi:hypothetical protein